MFRLVWLPAVVFTLLFFPSLTQAQEDKKDPPAEWIPPPRPVIEPALPYYIPNSLPMPGTREVWQYFGVDRTGRFRPLVINSPLGAYYYYNGQPYPWNTTRPTLVMPWAVD